MKRGVALGVLCAVGLLLAGPAHATMRLGKPVSARWLVRHLSVLSLAQAAAVEYWGGEPCGGSVVIAYTNRVPSDVNVGGVPLALIEAWTSFDTPLGPLDYSQPPASYTACVVTVNSDNFPLRAQGVFFARFCALMVHEYGHLFGHPDLAADPPTSITYPLIGPQNERVAPCVARYRLAALLARLAQHVHK